MTACVALNIGLLASAVATMIATRESALADAGGNLARMSLTLAEHSQRVIFGADLILSSLEDQISRARIRSADEFGEFVATRQMYERLREMVLLSPDVDSLAISDSAGAIVAYSRAWPTPHIGIADREHFRLLRDNPTLDYVVSAPLKDRATGLEIIVLARRVNGRDGAFLGVIAGILAASRFDKLLPRCCPPAARSDYTAATACC